mgnify:CR=1 FL=1
MGRKVSLLRCSTFTLLPILERPTTTHGDLHETHTNLALLVGGIVLFILGAAIALTGIIWTGNVGAYIGGVCLIGLGLAMAVFSVLLEQESRKDNKP